MNRRSRRFPSISLVLSLFRTLRTIELFAAVIPSTPSVFISSYQSHVINTKSNRRKYQYCILPPVRAGICEENAVLCRVDTELRMKSRNSRHLLSFTEERPGKKLQQARRNRKLDLKDVAEQDNTAIDLGTTTRSILDLVDSTIGTDKSHTRSNNNNGGRLYQYVMHAISRLSYYNVKNVLDFLMDILPDDLDVVRKIVHDHPRILRRSVNTQLRPIEELLRSLYGDDMFKEALTRNPSLLLVSGVGFSTRNEGATEQFLQSFLGMSASTIRQMKKMSPYVFQLSVDDTILPLIQFLNSILRSADMHGSGSDGIDAMTAGISSENKRIIRRIILNYPAILSLNVEDNLQPTVNFLQQSCFLDRRSLSNLLRSCPGVLGLSVEDNLRFKLESLRLILCLDKDVDVERCLCRHPQILGLSMNNLRQKVDYFNVIDTASRNSLDGVGAVSESIHLDRRSLAYRIAMAAPSVYSLSLSENIRPKIHFLCNVWGLEAPNFSSEINVRKRVEPEVMGGNSLRKRTRTREVKLAQLLAEYPPILTLSLSGNIQPTVDFLNRTGYVKLDGSGHAQSSDLTFVRPRYLASSLFSRLSSRWHYLARLTPIWNGKALDGQEYLPPLHILAGANDVQFCNAFDLPMEDFLAWKINAIPKLKFSSQFNTWVRTGRPIDAIG